MFEKNKITLWFKIKYNKNNLIVLGQCTIAESEPTQLYPVMIQIRTILITHHSNNYCRIFKHNKQDPSCSINSYCVTE